MPDTCNTRKTENPTFSKTTNHLNSAIRLFAKSVNSNSWRTIQLIVEAITLYSEQKPCYLQNDAKNTTQLILPVTAIFVRSWVIQSERCIQDKCLDKKNILLELRIVPTNGTWELKMPCKQIYSQEYHKK